MLWLWWRVFKAAALMAALGVGVLFMLRWKVAQAQPPLPQVWGEECVDCPRSFYGDGPRVLQFDTDGQPHVIYGGDHLYYARRMADGWTYETVDATRGVGAGATLALDAGNTPHILYCDRNGYKVKYARGGSGGWSTSVVTSTTARCDIALAVDAAGRPHIVFATLTDTGGGTGVGAVQYGVLNNGTWRYEQVAKVTSRAAVDLVLDASGQPRVAYMAGDNGKVAVQYATRSSREWTSTAAITPYDYSWPTSVMLALDKAGNAHILYVRSSGGAISSYNLWYVHQGPGGWQDEELAPPDSGMGAIALDANGHPHVAFAAEEGDALYLRWDGAAWVKEIIADAQRGLPSLVLDGAGRPYIVYAGTSLQYAARTDSGWQIELVDRSAWAGPSNSLALDAAGRPVLAYQRAEAYHPQNLEQITVASRISGEWQSQAVYTAAVQDGIGLVDHAVDPAGNLHIGFVVHHSYTDTVHYAAWDGSAWSVETVETIPSTEHLALELDAAGHPHMTYGLSELRYTYKKNGLWVFQSVAMSAQGNDIGALALALGRGGEAVISFYETGVLRLARRHGEAWEVSKVADIMGVLEHTGLALDAAGNPQLAYCGALERLQYARWTGAAWDIQPVGSAQELEGCEGVALALELLGRPHLSYVLYNHPVASQKYARLMYATSNGAAWTPEVIKDIGNPGDTGYYTTAVAVDSTGMPRISTHDPVVDDLIYLYLLDCEKIACRYTYIPWIGLNARK